MAVRFILCFGLGVINDRACLSFFFFPFRFHTPHPSRPLSQACEYGLRVEVVPSHDEGSSVGDQSRSIPSLVSPAGDGGPAVPRPKGAAGTG